MLVKTVKRQPRQANEIGELDLWLYLAGCLENFDRSHWRQDSNPVSQRSIARQELGIEKDSRSRSIEYLCLPTYRKTFECFSSEWDLLWEWRKYYSLLVNSPVLPFIWALFRVLCYSSDFLSSSFKPSKCLTARVSSVYPSERLRLW